MNEEAGSGRKRDRAASGCAGVVPFAPGDSVVYPGHGVGEVTGLESHHVGDHELRWFFVINFAEDRMTLRVPLQKAESSGLRRISTRALMESALAKLEAPQSRTRSPWSRQAHDYATKINSGDPCLIAEVLRDLRRASGEPRRSYWKQLLYGQALGRLVQELAAVYDSRTQEVMARLELMLDAA